MHVCMFVARTRKNYFTDFDETLQKCSLDIRIGHTLTITAETNNNSCTVYEVARNRQ